MTGNKPGRNWVVYAFTAVLVSLALYELYSTMLRTDLQVSAFAHSLQIQSMAATKDDALRLMRVTGFSSLSESTEAGQTLIRGQLDLPRGISIFPVVMNWEARFKDGKCVSSTVFKGYGGGL